MRPRARWAPGRRLLLSSPLLPSRHGADFLWPELPHTELLPTLAQHWKPPTKEPGWAGTGNQERPQDSSHTPRGKWTKLGSAPPVPFYFSTNSGALLLLNNPTLTHNVPHTSPGPPRGHWRQRQIRVVATRLLRPCKSPNTHLNIHAQMHTCPHTHAQTHTCTHTGPHVHVGTGTHMHRHMSS